MPRLGIFSDTHIGRNIPRVVGDARRKAFRHAFHQAIDIFLREKVDYVIHGGDLFEKRSMTPEDAVFVKEELYRLAKNIPHIKIIAVRGNHDGSPHSSSLDYVTHPLAEYFIVLGDKTLKGEKENYVDDNLCITAMGYHPYAKTKFKEISSIIKESWEGGAPRILLLHNYIDGVHDIPPSAPDHSIINPKEIEKLKPDIVIAGHQHEPIGVRKTGGISYILPGSTEAVDLAEEGPFGVHILELDGHKIDSYRFVGIEPLHEIRNEVLSPDKPMPLEWFAEKCLNRLEELASGLSRDAIVRMQVKGVAVTSSIFPELDIQDKVDEIRRKYPRLIHVEIIESLKPIIGDKGETKPGGGIRIREIFEELGGEALELIDEVSLTLDERASEKTGILRESDREEFVERWVKIFLQKVREE